MVKRIYVFAGSYQQAVDFMRLRGVSPSAFRYISKRDDLRGIRSEKYLRVGTWYERPDYYDIEEMLEARDMIEITLPEPPKEGE